MSYPGCFLFVCVCVGGSYSSAEMQSVYSIDPTDCAVTDEEVTLTLWLPFDHQNNDESTKMGDNFVTTGTLST